MADRTVTDSPALNGNTNVAMAVHAGLNSVPFSWTANGKLSISLSDVVYLAKIPFDAIVTRLACAGWIGSAGNATVDVGLSGATSGQHASVFVSGGAVSATATTQFTVLTGAIPIQVTGSDDAAVRFKYLQAKWVTSATGTATAILSGVVEYVVGRKAV